MDPKLAFWTLAFANFGVITWCAALGVRRIRRKDVAGQRRMMGTAAALVLLFLVAYVGKVFVLGKEDRSTWTQLDHAVLYVHESCVMLMLIAGLYAGYRAWRFRGHLGPKLVLPPESDPLFGRTQHRRAGWTAIAGCVLALVTAAGVPAGMFSRTG